MTTSVRILWTKQLTKKQKTWNDGFVLLKPSGAAILYDDAGKELSVSRLTKGVTSIADHDDPLRCWEGYLVQYDSDCQVSDIPGIAAGPVCTGVSLGSGSYASSKPEQRWQRAAPLAALQQPQTQTRAPVIPQAMHRRKICTGRTRSPQKPTAAAPQQRQGQHAHQLQSAAGHVARSCFVAKPNTDVDILQLLDSIVPVGSTRSPNDECKQTVQGQQQHQPQLQQHGASRPNYQCASGAAPNLDQNQVHCLPQQLPQCNMEQPPQKPQQLERQQQQGRQQQQRQQQQPQWQQQCWSPQQQQHQPHPQHTFQQQQQQWDESAPVHTTGDSTAQPMEADSLDALDNALAWQHPESTPVTAAVVAPTASCAVWPEQASTAGWQQQQQHVLARNEEQLDCSYDPDEKHQSHQQHQEQQKPGATCSSSLRSLALQAAARRWGTPAAAAAFDSQQPQLADMGVVLDLDCVEDGVQQLPNAAIGSSMQLDGRHAASSRWAHAPTGKQQQLQAAQQCHLLPPVWQQLQQNSKCMLPKSSTTDVLQHSMHHHHHQQQQQQQQQKQAAPQTAGNRADGRCCASVAAAAAAAAAAVSRNLDNVEQHGSSISTAQVRPPPRQPVSEWRARQPLQLLHRNTQPTPNLQQQQHPGQLELQDAAKILPAAAAAAAVASRGATDLLLAGFKMHGGFVTPRLAAPPGCINHHQQHQQQHPDRLGTPKGLAVALQQQQQLAFQFPPVSRSTLLRYAAISTSFKTATEYKSALLIALTEEVNLKLAEQARTFHNVVQQVMAQQQQQQQEWSQGATAGSTQQNKRPLQLKTQQTGSLAQLQALCSRQGMQYHPNCTLTVYQRSSSSSKFGGHARRARHKGGKGKGGRCAAIDDCDSGGEEEQVSAPVKLLSMMLTLPGKLDRRKFRKHDLWVLSDQAQLTAAASPTSRPHTHTNQSWVAVGRSLWHAPDRDGRMEVELLPGQMPPHHRWVREQAVAALQAPDVTTEVQVAEFISSMDFVEWPLLCSLIQQQQAQQQPPGAAAAAAGQMGCSARDGKGALIPAADEPSSPASSNTSSSIWQGGGSKSDVLAEPKLLTSCATEQAAAGASSSDSEFEVPVAACRRLTQQQHQPVKKPRPPEGSTVLAHSGSKSDGYEQEMPSNCSDAAAAVNAPDISAATAEQWSLQAKARGLLQCVVQRFKLNEAQAQVAAHVADWLPQLMAQQQQQQRSRPTVGLQRQKGTAAGAAASTTTSGARSSSSSSSSMRTPPVCLIHGPFGSGKSTLLVALIHLLTGLAPGSPEPTPAATDTGARKRKAAAAGALKCPRILIAAHTNVAVDRVLLALLDSGFTNMLRVGSLQRIARRLLAHSLHSGDDSKDAVSQLQGMLQDATGAEEALIRSEIAQVQAGADRQRRKRLSTAAVVGATCCSALQATLEGQQFDVVLLDESSQMTEPTSLVPLLRARPRFLIAAGDPCQLPPVLASPTGVSVAAAHAPGSRGPGQQQQQDGLVYGLLRPLFVRLTHLGHKAHLLSHQYRCHPTLSVLSNKHFYNSLLVNGVTERQRAAIIPGLPPLVFVHCQGGRSQAAELASRSSINHTEARLVVQLVTALLRCRKRPAGQLRQQQQPEAEMGQFAAAAAAAAAAAVDPSSHAQAGDGLEGLSAVAAHQVGVICFFRGQANLIKQMLTTDQSCPGASEVQVATVDSFQGAEKELIVLATTTTNPRSEFCSDGARLNVALTRAKRHLVVVGAAEVLSAAPGPVLTDLVHSCRCGTGGASFMTVSGLLALPALAAGRQGGL